MSEKFVILGTQRTGSTALYNSLNFHPDIACGGEWTQRIAYHKKLAVSRRALSGDFSDLSNMYREFIADEYRQDIPWLGFKVLFRSTEKWLIHPCFSPALFLDRLESYIRWLSRCPEIRIIHIVRNDSVDWLKSRYLSRKTGMFSHRSYPEGIKVEIPYKEAVKQLRSKNWVDSRIESLADTNPYLCVSYEEFVRSKKSVVLHLMKLLECDPAQIGELEYGGLIRQSTGHAQDYISNYDELVAELRKGGFISS